MGKLAIMSATLLSVLVLAACAGGGQGRYGSGGERDANWEDRVDDMTRESQENRRSSITGSGY